MRGTIKKRAKGSWTIVLDLPRGADGKRRQLWRSVKGTRRDAESRLAALIAEVERGGYVRPTKTTVGQFLSKWLDTYAATNVRPRTLEGYQERARRIIERLDSITLSELRPDHLQGYYSERLAEGLSAGTLVKHHNLIRQALAHAIKWRLLSVNVADAVDPPRPGRREPTILLPEHVQTFLDVARAHYYYPLFHTALWTGMRRSELLGLKWGDVDLTLGTLSVVRVLHQLKDGSFIFDRPKTAKGQRQIALSPTSCLTLRAHREAQEAIGLPTGPEALVFCKPDGTPMIPASVTHAFSKTVRKAGFAGVRFHDLRHTHASLLLQQNVHPKVVSERLGHANVQITLDTYSHVVPGMQEKAALRFDEVVFNATKQPV